jgi:hypothetical protein
MNRSRDKMGKSELKQILRLKQVRNKNKNEVVRCARERSEGG